MTGGRRPQTREPEGNKGLRPHYTHTVVVAVGDVNVPGGVDLATVGPVQGGGRGRAAIALTTQTAASDGGYDA